MIDESIVKNDENYNGDARLFYKNIWSSNLLLSYSPVKY